MFRRKQVVVLSLVLMILIAGYLQYSYKKSSVSPTDKPTGKLGEAVFVDSSDSKPADKTDTKKDTKSSASKQAVDFFAQAKLDREITRSKNSDSLKSITNDLNASKDAKDKAFTQIQEIISMQEKERKIETLIKERGFSDAVVIFGDDKSVDVVVEAPNLTTTDVAKISDIVSRQANVAMNGIHVRIKY